MEGNHAIGGFEGDVEGRGCPGRGLEEGGDEGGGVGDTTEILPCEVLDRRIW